MVYKLLFSVNSTDIHLTFCLKVGADWIELFQAVEGMKTVFY